MVDVLIKPVGLPSGDNKTVVFRHPKVSDASAYAHCNPMMEERITTLYLKALIVESTADKDPVLWTSSDRRYALWWIFVNIMPDTKLTYTYQCKYCQKQHVLDYDLRQFAFEATELDKLPIVKDIADFAGKPRPFEVLTPTGVTMEALEASRSTINGKEEPHELEYIKRQLAIQHLIHCIRFEDETALVDDAARLQHRLDIVNDMTSTEFAWLSGLVKNGQETLRHGLHTEVVDGKIALVTPPIPCANKEDGSDTVRLRLDFRCLNFIPPI